MIKDIIENTQLFVLGAWNDIVSTLVPQPEKREAIRIGNAQMAQVRGKYRELDNLLRTEAVQLEVTHNEERSRLFSKQKDEKTALNTRHAEVRAEGKDGIRQTRAMVISNISAASSGAKMRVKPAAPPARAAKPTTRAKAKLVPVTVMS